MKVWNGKLARLGSIAALAIMLVVTGCSNNGNSSGGNTASSPTSAGSDAGGTEAPRSVAKFTIEVPDLPDVIGKKDRVTAYMVDKFNLDLTFIAPSFGEAMNKLRLLVASGDVPDAFDTPGPGNPDYEQWVKDGLVLDITEIAKNYPNIQKILDDPNYQPWKTKDGKWYGIPKYFDGVLPHAFQIRQDWLDSLNLQTPTTTDELYEVLKAFKENDPDGKNNTPLSADNLSFLREFFLPGYTGMNGWGKVDGGYLMPELAPGYTDYLKYMNKLYSEGLLDPDFVLEKQNTAVEKFVSGRAGVMSYNIDAAIFNNNYDSLLKSFPNAEMSIIGTPIAGPKGGFQPANSVNAISMMSFSSKIKEPERLFELIDYLLSEEGQQLTRYGLEGIHYTKNGDEIVINEAEIDADKQQVGDITWSTGVHVSHILASYDYTRFISDTIPRVEQLREAFEKTHANPLINEVVGLKSDNLPIIGPKISDVITEYEMKFITGKLDIDKEYDKFVQEVHKAGWPTLEKEINEFMGVQ